MMSMQFYEVGGALRDAFMGRQSKDLDYAVEAPSLEVLQLELVRRGLEIFLVKPEYLTIRAKTRGGLVADYVLCRKDSAEGDGRRPASVDPATIYEDLARRDFTVNAMARTEAGQLLDPYGGREHCASKTLEFVGDPRQRIREDGLRVLRGYRFMVTHDLLPTTDTEDALNSSLAASMLHRVSPDRMREELAKMFAHDTLKSMRLFRDLSTMIHRAIFRDGLRMMPTMRS